MVHKNAARVRNIGAPYNLKVPRVLDRDDGSARGGEGVEVQSDGAYRAGGIDVMAAHGVDDGGGKASRSPERKPMATLDMSLGVSRRRWAVPVGTDAIADVAGYTGAVLPPAGPPDGGSASRSLARRSGWPRDPTSATRGRIRSVEQSQ
jgi:hypothetical protein